ncbi:hypothetical protein [uncultured Polaribacter sp.]|uniref:hypothetical protein n=1 Tax=uncultured Polaribacter sp. TaxID=174711 RepID=UPI00259B5B6B|nr:hypothetical protein [uncultured Polaribacter sp.]
MSVFSFLVDVKIENFHQSKSQLKQGFTRQFDLLFTTFNDGIIIDLEKAKTKKDYEF